MENNVDNIVDLQWLSLVAFSITSSETQTEAHTVHGIFGPITLLGPQKKCRKQLVTRLDPKKKACLPSMIVAHSQVEDSKPQFSSGVHDFHDSRYCDIESKSKETQAVWHTHTHIHAKGCHSNKDKKMY